MRAILLAIGLLLGAMPAAQAQVSVVTQHNDNERTGQNLSETVLNTSNVAVSQFGKLFTRTVSGDITGQPLYLQNVTISGSTHNVVYVATSNNNVYAFDADDPAQSTALWSVNLGATATGAEMGANDASTSSYPTVAGWHTTGGTYGVQSTPVIDSSTGTIYVCAAESISGAAQYVLHGLDVTSGAEKFGGPVTIAASVSGTGEQSVSGTLSFHADRQLQRPGLLLANGKVYIGFGGHADMEPLHGWVIAYDAGVLGSGTTPSAVFCSTPNGARGAIWQSGQGISSDTSGNIFVATGDGTFDADTGGTDYGDSILQLNSSLAISKSFTPFNQNLMAWYQDSSNNWQGDMDLGSSCLLLIPGANLAFQGSKDGKVYEVDLTALTWGYNSTADSEIVDSFQAGTSTFNLQAAQQVHSMVYWNGSSGPFVYAWPDTHTLQAYQLSGGTLVHPTSILGSDSGGSFAGLSISANGATAGSGILWAMTSSPALRAYDASNVASELWNSTQNSSRDGMPSQANWSTPTIANGHVYVGTTSNKLVAYGLLAPYAPTNLRTAGGGGVVSLSWNSSLGNTSYNVKRSTVSGGPYTTIATGITDYDLGTYSVGTYLDLAVTNGTTYYYVVSAVNSIGEGPNTAEASGTPSAPATSQASIVSAVTPPTIDGDPSDSVWSSAPSYACRNIYLEVPSSTTDLSGNFRMAWDSTYLYALYTVTDDVLVNDSINPWDDDDVELYIDTTNSRASSYGSQDFEYSFGWNDTVVWEQHSHTTGVVYAQTNTSTGYIIEAKIPWTTLGLTPTNGHIIGLDAAIAEDDDGGIRDSRMAWIDNNNDAWHLPSIFGTGELLPPVPGTPTGLTATAGDTQVSLGWTATSGATSYNVKRSTISGGPYATVATPGTNSDVDTGLTNGTTYYYVVSAVNDGGESGGSSQASATPEPPVPGTPTGFTATAGDTQVTLNWSASSGATSYNVKRSTINGGPYTTVATPSTNSDTDTGLTNGTTYYYVVSAVNAGGESSASTQASATPEPPAPGTPTGFTATAGDTQVTLAWTATSGATSYNVKRSTINGGPYTTVATPGTNTDVDTSLTNGTTYYYVVSAVNGGGESSDSSQASATPEPPVPGTPTGFTATAGDTQVTLAWTATSGATSYNVKRSTINGGPYTTVASPSTISDTDTGLTNGVTYYYVVSAVNGGGESGDSSQASATPEPPAPGTPVGLGTVAGDTQVTLNWTATSGATSYNVKRSTISGGPYTTVASPATNSNTDTGLTNGTAYYYVISAVNGGGESANSTQSGATPEPPTPGAPTGLGAVAGNTTVTLSWTATSGATSYNVKRSTISGGPYTTVASPSTNSDTDTGLTNGVTYYYVISAVNGGGESGNSSQASATPEPPVPGTPVGLTATPGNTQVILAWTATSGATSYNVKRSTITGGPYTTVASPSTNSYTNIGLTNGVTYFYVVSAVNGGGESGNSTEASATPEPPIPGTPTGLSATPGNAQVSLSWTASSGATTYNVKRSTVNGGPYTTVASPATNSLLDTGLTNGLTYYYVVSAVNGGGESGNSTQASATPQPPAPGVPSGLTAVAGTAQVTLNWSAASNATSYSVKRSTVNGGPYTTVATGIVPTTFTNTGLTNGTVYFFVVSAVNTVGESANSAQVSAKPIASPTGLTAVPGNAQVALTWNNSNLATSYNVLRATVSGGPYTTVATGVQVDNSQNPFVHYTDFSVVNGTTYFYVVVALNTNAQSGNSNEISALPQGPAPANLTATPFDARIALAWSAYTGATSYNVKRSTVTGGPYTTVGSPTTNSFSNTGLTNGTTYFYVVSAVSGTGAETINSNEASAKPKAVPVAPTGLTATPGNAQVTLTWNNLLTADNFNVKRSTVSGGPYTTVATQVAALSPNNPTVSYTNTGLTNGVTYFFVVSGSNVSGEGANSNQASATPQGAAPANLTATAGDAQISLAWTAYAGATSYNVKRSTITGGPYATVGSPTTNSFSNTGLTNGTIYYYVVSAVSGAGAETVNSNEASATPKAVPAAPTGLTAVAGDAQVALTWTNVSSVPNYNVKRSTTAGGPYTTIASGIQAASQFNPTVSFTNTGLTNGVTYFFVVSGVNASGEGPNSNEASATPEPAAPGTPVGLTATPGDTVVTLTWTPSGGATAYNVKRSTVNGGPYTTIASPASSGYSNTGLTNGTTYYYVVSAVNGGGESANSTQASATPQPPAPGAPTGLNATPGNAQVILSWVATFGATSYNVKRSTVNGGPYTTVASPTTANYTNTGLTNGVTYYYVVTAVNGGGESGNSAQASATPEPPIPGTPTGLTATPANTQVTLSWTASSGATAYNVKRSTVTGGPYATVGSPSSASFVDTGLTNGTTYFYVVSAVNGGGESGNSTEASATPQIAIPNAPTGLTATPGDTQIVLGWTATPSATSYNVKRSTVNGGPYATVASPATNSATDTGLTNGITYYYVVTALNVAGESGNSSQASATPEPPAPGKVDGVIATAGDTQIVLTWNPKSGATSYNVKRATTNGGPYNNIANPATNSDTDTGLTNGVTYYYVVTAVNGGGEGINSNQAGATPEPPAPGVPTGLVATPGNAQISLVWNTVSGATSYNVKRSTVTGGPYTTIASPASNSYTNTGLTNGTTYFYVISAVNSGGESANSTEASATPQLPVPGTPTGLGATPGDTQVGLSWTAVGLATSYNVKRATVNGGPYTTIASPATNSYLDPGLTNGVTYYYVVSAVNGSGESADSAQVSATPSSGPTIPLAPDGLTASPGIAQVVLNWNASSGATSYNVKRSTVSGGPYATVAGPSTTSYTNTGLTNGVTYFYVVTAVNTAGESANSGEASATPFSLSNPTIAAATGNGQITLSWTAISGATTYNLYRSVVIGGEGPTPYRTGLTGTSFIDTGLTNGSTYFYQLTAMESGIESGKSNEASAIPELAPKPAPGTVVDTTSSLAAGLVLCAPINEGSGATDIKNVVDGSTATLGSGWSWITTSEGLAISGNGAEAGTAFQAANLPTGNITVFVIGNATNSNFFTQGQDIPNAPVSGWGVQFNTGGSHVFTTAQTDVTGSLNSRLVHVGMTRSGSTETLYVNGASVGTAADSGSAIRASGVHDWAIGGGKAAASPNINGWISYVCVWNRTLSPAEMAQINANPYAVLANSTVPGVPTGVTATPGNGQVSLTWNTSFTATTYNVKRSTTAGGPYTTIATPATTSLLDTGVTNNITYYYVVSAVNAIGESGNSTEAAATPAAPPIPAVPTGLNAVPGSAHVTLTWSAVNGATSYNVKQSTVNGGPYATVSSPSTSSFNNTGLTNGTTYYYVVSAVNSGGESADSAQVSATPTSLVPPTLAAASGNGQIVLTWNATAGATAYNLYRGLFVNGENSVAYKTNLSGTTYTDTGLTNGTPYYYKITAVGSEPESLKSNEASAIPEAAAKPASSATINAASPLASGLMLCAPINEGAGATAIKNLVNGSTATLGSGWSWINTSEGIAISGNGTEANTAFTTGTVPSGDLTVFVIGNSNNSNLFAQDQAGLQNGNWGLFFNTGGSHLFTTAETDIAGSFNNRLVHVGMTRSGSAETLYLNGASVGTATDTGTALRTSAPHVWAIGGGKTTGTGNINGWISYVCVWNRALSPSEMAQLNTNPYAFLH